MSRQFTCAALVTGSVLFSGAWIAVSAAASERGLRLMSSDAVRTQFALDGNGNLPFAVDFRSYYATFLERWWGIDSSAVLGGRFAPVAVL